MQKLNRRSFLRAGVALAALGSFARQTAGQHEHGGLYERLDQRGRVGLPDAAAVQHVFESPAPKAANTGRWVAKAPLPLPRSEMAWAASHDDKMHLVGDRIHVAGGGPIMGGSVQSAMHEAFTLAS